ncbi:MAG: UbiA family prenyltransferase, partial [Thiohalomonadaceae bacterium]
MTSNGKARGGSGGQGNLAVRDSGQSPFVAKRHTQVPAKADDYPLFVDLDNTLINTDLLIEGCLALLKANIFYAFSLLLWLLRGKAFLKAQVSLRVTIDPEQLPYNEDLLEYLREEWAAGRPLVLATASDIRAAKTVASHLGIFANVLASDGHTNLSGSNKLKAIRELSRERPFAYIGDSKEDLLIFQQAAQSIAANSSPRLERMATKRGVTFSRTFPRNGASLITYTKALRVHQWAKNGLLFAPLIAAHEFGTAAISSAFIGFVAFSLCASAVYLLNDMLDLAADRAHPRKRYRPLASGAMRLVTGMILSVLLTVGGVAVATVLGPVFMMILGAYLALTTAYSWRLKRYAVVDVVTLAGLYTLRIIAGAVAIGAFPSFWILAFSMFLFLSLAFVKRCSELRQLSVISEYAPGRGYHGVDYDVLRSLGVASGYVSVLVIALFINSRDVLERYSHPEALWMLCPIMLFWVSRLWVTTNRGEMHDDPLVFSLYDKGSHVAMVLAAG